MFEHGRVVGHGDVREVVSRALECARTASFKNAVVIMTSNIGSQWILDPDLTEVEMNHRVMEAMRAAQGYDPV